MKAIGAQTGQLVAMYLLMVVCFGLLGLFLGSLLVEIVGSGAGTGISGYLNFRPGPPRTPIQGTIIQIIVAIFIPLFAALLPVIKGTRITVYDVLEYLAGGMTEDQILSAFPSLKREDIRACLAFAADRERRLASSNA